MSGKFSSSEGFFGNENTTLDRIQTELDVIGWIPGIGDVADGANGLISLYRKDYVSAGLDLVSMVPLIGDVIGKGGKIGKKIIQHGDEVADIGKLLLKNSDEIASLSKGAIKNISPNQGFDSFRKLKKTLGSAGEGKHWHHIVEQAQIKKSGFSPYQIHNTSNIIAVDAATHAKITGHYNTTTFDFTGGLSVRDWLAGQSYENQYKYGVDILKQFGVIQ